MISLFDHEPSFFLNPPQHPIISPCLAASTPVSNLSLVSIASTGMTALWYFSPLNLSINQKFLIHFSLRSGGIPSSQPAVPWKVSLRSSFNPVMMGASSDLACLLLKSCGKKSSRSFSSPSKSLTVSGSLPLRDFPKCSFGTFSSTTSPSRKPPKLTYPNSDSIFGDNFWGW